METGLPRDPERPLYRSVYRGPVEVATLDVDGTSIRLARPSDPDLLLDDPEVIDWNQNADYMPYWPYLWPSSFLLAEWVARQPWPDLADESAAFQVLEIGRGPGLPGLVGIARGLRVQLSDHDPAPLEFVARSAAENRFDPGHYSIRQLDWHSLPDERFSIVLGADVIYELRLVRLVAALLSQILAPDGVGVIASPYRVAAEGFPAALADAGLTSQERVVTTRTPEGQAFEGTIYHVRRASSMLTSGIVPAASLSI
jgi:predicted nicotinamide N-methyase